MKVLEKMEKAKVAVGCAVPAVVGALYPVAVYAAEEGDTTDAATTALTTALTSMASSISTAIGAVLPIAIPLVGAGLVVTIGLNVFKRIASKA